MALAPKRSAGVSRRGRPLGATANNSASFGVIPAKAYHYPKSQTIDLPAKKWPTGQFVISADKRSFRYPMSTTPGPSSEERTPDKAPAAEAKIAETAGNGERHRQRITVGIAVVAAIALGVLGYWFFFLRGIVYTDDARFSGHLVDLAPEINGRLIEVAVRESRINYEEAGRFLRFYEDGLQGYTYLEEPHEK